MKRSEVLARARHAAAVSQTRYALGAGGRKPKAPLPEDDRGLDCSGFYAWCLGVDRYYNMDDDPEKEWIETTAIVRSARSGVGPFELVENPRPGDGIVWGDSRGKQGHVGIVSEVVEGKATKVIHCSTGNQRAFGKAIAETDAGIFHRNNAIYVRFDATEEDEVIVPPGRGLAADHSCTE